MGRAAEVEGPNHILTLQGRREVRPEGGALRLGEGALGLFGGADELEGVVGVEVGGVAVEVVEEGYLHLHAQRHQTIHLGVPTPPHDLLYLFLGPFFIAVLQGGADEVVEGRRVGVGGLGGRRGWEGGGLLLLQTPSLPLRQIVLPKLLLHMRRRARSAAQGLLLCSCFGGVLVFEYFVER